MLYTCFLKMLLSLFKLQLLGNEQSRACKAERPLAMFFNYPWAKPNVIPFLNNCGGARRGMQSKGGKVKIPFSVLGNLSPLSAYNSKLDPMGLVHVHQGENRHVSCVSFFIIITYWPCICFESIIKNIIVYKILGLLSRHIGNNLEIWNVQQCTEQDTKSCKKPNLSLNFLRFFK